MFCVALQWTSTQQRYNNTFTSCIRNMVWVTAENKSVWLVYEYNIPNPAFIVIMQSIAVLTQLNILWQ